LSLDPAKKKYLFIIADGLPHGTGYSGKEAEKHVKSVCSFVRTKLKISTYAFGVGVNSHSDVAQFTSQYGENNTVFISNVKQALPKIVRFLRHVLQKEKTLVDANTD
jgi:nitric oxide reductase activation protein